MARFEDLIKVDILSPLLPMLDSGALRIDLQTMKISLGKRYQHEGLWIYFNYAKDRQACGLWWNIYYDVYRMIPFHCNFCWKVYAILDTLEDAFSVLDAFTGGRPGKIGPETRAWTGRLGTYPVFWYVPLGATLDEARNYRREIYKDVLAKCGKRVADKLRLKRGCSEYERDFGPSDEWPWPRPLSWDLREALADTLFEPASYEDHKMFGPARTSREIRWIRYAYEYGDQTYLKFVNEPFSRTYVNYDGSIHKSDDFPDRSKMTNFVTLQEENDGTGCDGSKFGESEGREAGSIITLSERESGV